jgi:hypothetical protein
MVAEVIEGHAIHVAVELAAMLDLARFELLQGGHDRILKQVRRELGVARNARELRLETRHVSKEHLVFRSFLVGARIG